jgi:hypothetical protein
MLVHLQLPDELYANLSDEQMEQLCKVPCAWWMIVSPSMNDEDFIEALSTVAPGKYPDGLRDKRDILTVEEMRELEALHPDKIRVVAQLPGDPIRVPPAALHSVVNRTLVGMSLFVKLQGKPKPTCIG